MGKRARKVERKHGGLPRPWRPGGLRMRMFEDQDGKCCYCGLQMVIYIGTGRQPDRRATVEHLRSKSQGGSNDVGNRRIACAKCNRGKGKRNWLEWKTICMGEAV